MTQRRIGEVLVGGRAISAEARDRALAQQVRSKGRFGSNLLELGGIREDLLLRALSVQHGTAPATAADLAEIPPQVIRLVPGKLATSLFVVPFKRSGRTLSLAMRDPKDLPAIDEIAFLTGLAISPFVALDFRIQLALGHYYAAPVEPRYQALADRQAPAERQAPAPGAPPARALGVSQVPVPAGPLGEGPPWARRAGPAPPPVPAPPPPPPVLRGAEERPQAPTGLGQAGGDPWGAESSAGIEIVDEPPILTETLTSMPAPPPQPPISSVIELDDSHVRRLRGSPEPPAGPARDTEATAPGAAVEPAEPPEPTPAAETSGDLGATLARADSRDEVATAVLSAAVKKLRRAALFIAQPDRVIGWAAVPEPPQGLRSFSIAFSEPSLFASLRNTDGFYVGPSPDLPGNRRILEALGATLPATVAVVPVTLKGKSVLFLFGEASPGGPPPQAPELKRLAAQTAIALEILLLRNRLRSL